MTDTTVHRRTSFLLRHSYNPDVARPLAGDASSRRYWRLADHGLLLMEEVPGSPNLQRFTEISCYLRAIGLSAPHVRVSSFDDGLALVEDFGVQTFTRLIAEGHAEDRLYALAVDALAHLHESVDPRCPDLPSYDWGPLSEELQMFTRWYAPQCHTNIDNNEDFECAFLSEWRRVLQQVSARRDTLVLRDFHVDNLMVINGRSGVAACGLLDFQDALIGSTAYDLVSLTQDARRDLAPGLEDALIDRYLSKRPNHDRANWLADYRLLAAHRHTKILGNFERLSKRDGKHGYLAYIPRVQHQLVDALDQAELREIRSLMDKYLPGWSTHRPRPLGGSANVRKEATR
ncbi:aminoglycoside phosphotransferase family protein [Hyphomicrobium sp. MC8b]|uniref:aminoglycoside phosphotransferase family protein n=1 Tax=Hyphomicrobium sp. MC8b TaxID=300273 RepID=UPI00391DF59B